MNFKTIGILGTGVVFSGLVFMIYKRLSDNSLLNQIKREINKNGELSLKGLLIFVELDYDIRQQISKKIMRAEKVLEKR